MLAAMLAGVPLTTWADVSQGEVSKNGNDTTLHVKMKDSVHNLDELVVVGYGVQKRRDIIGAISSVNGDVLENRSNPNITRSLQGQVPGLTITMSDGKPIRTGSIHIRGNVNSIGAGGSALVLVDGVEGDLNAVNPDDVESISVLKDASSTAIYGARGAFGVILITTKKAKKGRPSIQYSGSLSFLSRTVKPQMVTNGLQWATDFYHAYVNYKGKEPSTINNRFNKFIVSWDDWYSELQRRDADPTLEKIRINGKGYYDYFGNTDWFGEIYKDSYTATQHNLSLSGGSDRATYLLSGGYYGTSGIYKIGDEKFQRFNLRAKGSLKLNRWLTVSDNIELWRRLYHEPAVMYSYDPNDLSTIIPIQRQIETQGFPVATLRNLDGTWTEAAVYTGYAGMYEGTSWRELKKLTVKNTAALTADILPRVLQAKAELGEMDTKIWDKTIRPLRERAGVKGDAPATADPYLISYYRNKCTDKWLLEIRRERAIELFFEGDGLRYDDLMRWGEGEMLTDPWNSIYIGEKNVAYDTNGDGVKDLEVCDKKPSETESGVYYIVLSKAPYYTFRDGRLYIKNENDWSDKKYLHPIPRAALVKNPNLKQNYGWED